VPVASKQNSQMALMMNFSGFDSIEKKKEIWGNNDRY